MSGYRILCINLGSTSSQAAVFEAGADIADIEVSHSAEDLKAHAGIPAQTALRKGLIEKLLAEKSIDLHNIDAIAARGIGMQGRYQAGAYRVSREMAHDALNARHVGLGVGTQIAYAWQEEYGIPAYLYDVVQTDEITDVARVSGTPLITRSGATHTLNTKAVARKVAAELGKTYENVTFIMCHLGGGISTSLHHNGRIVDVTSVDEGTFTPDRSGRVPCVKLLQMALSGKYQPENLKAMLAGNAGLIGYLGTNDCREIEQRIAQADKQAELIYKAMVYQTAKDIGALSAAACGRVDGIVLTGGIAYSSLFTGWLREMVSYLAPVIVYPGSMEMDALYQGVSRVLEGTETAKEYRLGETVFQ